MHNRIGIIMAGGKGTRLHPLTKVVNKHLLPVYDKPMIHYPLSTLIRLGHKKIYFISTRESIPLFKKLFGSGKKFKVKIIYKIQKKSDGIAACFEILKKEIKSKKTTLILGDNLFFTDIKKIKKKIRKIGSTVLLAKVKRPKQYGVAEIKKNKVVKLIEKPKKPKSDLVATGLYFFDENALNFFKKIKPSKRGEYEITDLNNQYIQRNKCFFIRIYGNDKWFDLGEVQNLQECSLFLQKNKKKKLNKYFFLKKY